MNCDVCTMRDTLRQREEEPGGTHRREENHTSKSSLEPETSFWHPVQTDRAAEFHERCRFAEKIVHA